MKSRSVVFVVVFVLLAGAGFLIWGKTRPETPAGPAQAGAPGAGKPSADPKRPPAPPLAVSGIKLAYVPFAEVINASGTLRAEESIELQAELNGKVIALNFKEGQRVKSGEVLVKIDDSSQQASLRRARARRDLAQLREQRLARLVAEGGVSQLEFDEARGELAVIDAEIDVIRAELAKTEIRAPFDGVVGIRFISVGAYVNPATRIATLQGIARLKVDFSVPERYSTLVRAGAPVSFEVAGGNAIYTGEVYAIEPRIDVSTRTVLLRALCDNPEGQLLPGTFARVRYEVSQDSQALLVPAIAVVSGLEERHVFVEKEGVARRVVVVTGARTTGEVQILKGLAPGDVVITSGIQQLRSGLAVAVRLAPPSATS